MNIGGREILVALHYHHAGRMPISVLYRDGGRADVSVAHRKREICYIKPKKEHRLRLALIRGLRRYEVPEKVRRAIAQSDGAYVVIESMTPREWIKWHKEVCSNPECKWAPHRDIFGRRNP